MPANYTKAAATYLSGLRAGIGPSRTAACLRAGLTVHTVECAFSQRLFNLYRMYSSALSVTAPGPDGTMETPMSVAAPSGLASLDPTNIKNIISSASKNTACVAVVTAPSNINLGGVLVEPIQDDSEFDINFEDAREVTRAPNESSKCPLSQLGVASTDRLAATVAWAEAQARAELSESNRLTSFPASLSSAGYVSCVPPGTRHVVLEVC
ncbi:unnamed protein product [Protopolystoma xenopodis]|uniref:Uncharacterized protein n=1 Tax=Protopolystoma xenopodis TaxID=117903 RepID=A0A448WNP3_9PLAT|nr:unnamed protein product [Protopolystoma xenopodis]